MLYTTGVTRGRRLVLIDIENIVGGGVEKPVQVFAAQAALTAAIGQRPDDHIILGCGRFSVAVVGFEWKGSPRLVFRAGRDGADLALLDVLETERVGERFSEVVLVSGDGIFAEAVSRLGGEGVGVTVVSRPEACARTLRMASAQTLDLAYDVDSFQEAA